ncbi:MAG: hypothetical protein AAGA60_01850 [Cyanobacteria bacterium P01_E01_bin.42]
MERSTQVVGIFTKFQQSVLNMALINICDSESRVGLEMRRQYNAWKQLTEETALDPWHDIHQFTIFLPHPDQAYEDITLGEGLTLGYNIEVQPVKDRSELVYNIFPGGHFVVILKQSSVDADFTIAATGIFVRPLATLSLDAIVDPNKAEYQAIAIKHPIIRDYPSDWETKMRAFLKGELPQGELPPVIRYVDRALNEYYRTPTWKDVYADSSGLLGR